MAESVQARIAKLREELKNEQLDIIKVAHERRKRARPGEAQKIILWEMNNLRHTETKYMAQIDRIMREAVSEIRIAMPGKMRLEGPLDKRPSHKARKMSLAQ
jgi:sugar-specific transcriptional regulator TrmB